MKRKRSRESTASRIIMLLFLAAAVILGISPKDGSKGSDIFSSIIPRRVELSAGTYDAASTELVAVLQSGETALLDEFDGLRFADLRGSGNFGEIAAWMKSHPDVKVLYDLELPNGKRYENSAVSVDLTGTAHDELEKTMELLEYLPNVTSIELGNYDGSEGSLTVDDMLTLFEKYPEAAFSYSFSVAGQTVDASTESLDLSGASHDELSAVSPLLSRAAALKTIDMGSESDGLSFDEVGLVQTACPDAEIEYRFELFGKEFSTLDESMDFWYVPMNDGGTAVRRVLPYMKRCTYVDMDSCGISNEDMAALQADFPEMKIVWRIWFAKRYSVRTDVEKILASKPSVGGTIYDEDASLLQYCTDVHFLDLGHNVEITDISFCAKMPKLEVFIIAMNNVSDLTPLEHCYNLEYLEIQTTNVTDISPLADLKSLRHLNIGELPGLTDISPLYGLTELERLWITSTTPIPADQVEHMRECAPNCDINTTASEPHGEKWRYYKYDPAIPRYWWVPRHELLREQMGYNGQDYSFYWLDPKCQEPCPPEYVGMYGV